MTTTLENALKSSTSLEALHKIFQHNVQVEINPLWGTDSVEVDGYDGVVSTDLIASTIWNLPIHDVKQEDSFVIIQIEDTLPENSDASTLAAILERKVFIPLRDQLIALENQSCGWGGAIYRIANCARIAWTPMDPALTGGYACLKHSMVLNMLRKTI